MEKIEKWEPTPGEQVAVRDRKNEPWNSREFLRKEKAELASPYQYICKLENGDPGMVGLPPGETGWKYAVKLPIMSDNSIPLSKVKKLPELEKGGELPKSTEFKLERIVRSKDSGGFADSMGIKYDICDEHEGAQVKWYLLNSEKCPVCEGISSLSRSIDEMREEKNSVARMLGRSQDKVQNLHEQIDTLEAAANEPKQVFTGNTTEAKPLGPKVLSATELREEQEEAKTIKLDSKVTEEFQQAFADSLIGGAIRRLVKPEALK